MEIESHMNLEMQKCRATMRTTDQFTSIAPTLPHFYISIFLHFYISTFLHFYIYIFLHFYISTFLHFYIAIFLHFYISIFLHFYISTLFHAVQCHTILSYTILYQIIERGCIMLRRGCIMLHRGCLMLHRGAGWLLAGWLATGTRQHAHWRVKAGVRGCLLAGYIVLHRGGRNVEMQKCRNVDI